MQGLQKDPLLHKRLKIFTDGKTINNPGPSYIGVLIKEGEKEIRRIRKFVGNGTSNEAEYMAMIEGMREALKLGAKDVEILTDSELVVRQMRGEYKVRAKNLKRLKKRAESLLKKFESFSITHIPRKENPAHKVAEGK